MAPSKKDRQREQTHQNLIETAERLFAEHGIAAVSLRQIGTEAGSLNTNAVGYYFGTKESLIEAIYQHRLPAIEQRRAKIVDELDQAGRGNEVSELMRATWLPLFELRDKHGNHSYARFLLSVQRAGLGWMRHVLNDQYPVASEISRRLWQDTFDNGRANPGFKITMQINMMVGALEYIDEQKLPDGAAKAVFNDAIRMTCAALLVGESSYTRGDHSQP
jgi:AcrR family transcriptional regulator